MILELIYDRIHDATFDEWHAKFINLYSFQIPFAWIDASDRRDLPKIPA